MSNYIRYYVPATPIAKIWFMLDDTEYPDIKPVVKKTHRKLNKALKKYKIKRIAVSHLSV